MLEFVNNSHINWILFNENLRILDLSGNSKWDIRGSKKPFGAVRH